MRNGWKILTLSLLILICTGSFAQSQKRYNSVTEYLESLVYNPTDTIISKVCSLIESVNDADSMATIAGIAYDFFTEPMIMGQEAVSVYIADNYFLNKRLKWSDEQTYPLLYTFAEFNRQSLIGKSAPQLELEDIDGNMINIRKADGQYKLLYFYDAHCATCAKQTPALIDMLKQYSGATISLFAIYTQSDKEEWKQYANDNFSSIDNDNVIVYNLWDPELDSDFQRKYSVLSTPSMFLLDMNNIIIGRRLNVEAASQLLNINNGYLDSYVQLFDSIFSSLNPVDSATAVQIGKALEKRTDNDSTYYRETFLELYKYLKDSNGEAAAAIAENFIVGQPSFWSEELLENISHSLYLFSLNKVGTTATDLTLTDKRGRSKSIHKIKSEYTLLLFHLTSCEDCQKLIQSLLNENSFLRKNKVKVVPVYVGGNLDLWKDYICKFDRKWIPLQDAEHNSGLQDKYDISIVPQVYLLNRNKIIIAKNVDIDTIKQIVSQ